MNRIPLCHPDRKHRAKGLCDSCYKQEWWKDRRDRLKEVRHNYYVRNRKRLIARSLHRYATRDQQLHSSVVRERMLRLKYQITPAQYEAIFSGQGGTCKICASPPLGRWSRLVVDHDHNTGAIRGLLCSGCNLKLGWFEGHRAMIETYLRKE